MNQFVADENLDDEEIVAACNAEGMCCMHRFPDQLRTCEDDEVLQKLLNGTATLVTLDATMVDENCSCIPDNNPGLVLVRLRRPSRSITSRIAVKLLQSFKARFPTWSETKWHGIYLEITEMDVFVSGLNDPPSVGKTRVTYSSATFEDEMKVALHDCARRAIGSADD